MEVGQLLLSVLSAYLEIVRTGGKELISDMERLAGGDTT